MLPSLMSVDLARWQFALDASFHFLFVPLTLGLTWIIFTMELAYVRTGKQVYKDMTRFWGKLLGINFALGVLTGLTMEFMFGTNWAYYSQYVGDIFGTPLAIEGLVAFMLESTFFGIFFFGWDKLSKKQHLAATFCLAIGSSFSALLILVANGFMQHPTGAFFDIHTMRMETTSLWHLFMNEIAQVGFAHTVTAGYTTAAVFVMGISAYYLLKGRDIDFAKRSFAVAAGFGLVASLMVVYMGDQNGLAVYRYQPMKLAAMEGVWNTTKAPDAWSALAIPNQAEHKNDWELDIPDALSLIVTHSLTGTVEGMNQLYTRNIERIMQGAKAYHYLEAIRQGDNSPQMLAQYKRYEKNLGYGLLLLQYTSNPLAATHAQVIKAANDTIPLVGWLFYTFRIMVAIGFMLFLTFIVALVGVIRNRNVWQRRWFHYWCLIAIPLPFVASLCGWFVTEHGRQPWTVYGMLPTDISSSTINATDVGFTLFMFMVIYLALFIVELFLMFKFGRMGPSALHTGRYHFEKQA
jgi:cytochrome d ubiquinol oxidase subunit I